MADKSHRLRPCRWEQLAKVFEKDGFVRSRTEGDHLVMTKTGVLRPVVIPMVREVAVFIIRNNMRTAGMTRARYFEILDEM